MTTLTIKLFYCPIPIKGKGYGREEIFFLSINILPIVPTTPLVIGNVSKQIRIHHKVYFEDLF